MVASVFLVSQIPGSYLNPSTRTNSTQSPTNDMSTTVLGNDLSTAQNDVNNTSANISTEQNLSTEFNGFVDENFLLNVNIERLNETPDSNGFNEKPNRTNWHFGTFSSWYTYFQTEAFDWSVIANRLAQREHENDTNESATNLFCNSTLDTGLFMLAADAGPVNINLNGIKLKWA